LFSTIAFATCLVYVVRVLGLDATTIGIVLGLGNIAAVAGAVMASRIGRRLGVGPTIIVSAILAGIGALLVPLAPTNAAIPFLLASGAVGGFANVVYNITQVSFRQAITPQRMQGRMNATMRFIVWGTIPIGSIIGGTLATTLGLHETPWIGTILGLFAFLPVLLSPVRDLRVMPQPRMDASARRTRWRPTLPTWRSRASRHHGPWTTRTDRCVGCSGFRQHRDVDAPLTSDLDGPFVARIHMAHHAHARVRGEDALQLAARQVRAIGDHDHARVLAVADAHATAMVDAHPRGTRGRVDQRIEQRPIRHGVRAVLHGLRLTVG